MQRHINNRVVSARATEGCVGIEDFSFVAKAAIFFVSSRRLPLPLNAMPWKKPDSGGMDLEQPVKCLPERQSAQVGMERNLSGRGLTVALTSGGFESPHWRS